MKSQRVFLVLMLGCVGGVYGQELAPKAVPVGGGASAVGGGIQVNPEQDWFDRAVNLYGAAKKDPSFYPSAIEQMEKYVSTYPRGKNATRANLYLGQLYYQSGMVAEARRVFDKLLRMTPRDAYVGAAAYTLGYDEFTKENFRDAGRYYAIYGECALTPEERARGQFLAAVSYLEGKDEGRAQGLLEKIAATSVETSYTVKANVLLGQMLVNQKKFPEALAALKVVLSGKGAVDAKNRAEAAVLAGQVSLNLNQLQEAKGYFDLVLNDPTLSSQRAAAGLGLMRVAALENDFGKLLQIWRDSGLAASDLSAVEPESEVLGEGDVPKAVLIDETRIERLLLVGKALKSQKELPDAMRAFAKAEELLPKGDVRRFEAGFLAILCRYQLKDGGLLKAADEFLLFYQGKFSREKRYQTVMWMKAQILGVDKKYEAAADLYRKVDIGGFTEENVKNFSNEKGECLLRAGDFVGAIAAYSEYLVKYEGAVNVVDVRNSRAYAYRMTGKWSLALVDCDWVLANSQDVGQRKRAMQEAAQTERAAKKPEGTVARYQELLKVSDLTVNERADANLNIGYAYLQMKDGVRAQSFLEEATKSESKATKGSAQYGLVISYHAQQNYEKLSGALGLAIDEKRGGEIPVAIYWWAGKRGYHLGDFALAAKLLSYVADYRTPSQTNVEVWQYLAKSLYEDGKYAQALVAVENEQKLEVTVDSELDRAKILFALKRYDEARRVVDHASGSQVEGVLGAGLRMVAGDLFSHEKKWDDAASCYGYVIEFIDDKELKPRAMSRMVTVLKGKGDEVGAEKYQQRLLSEFPNWKVVP